jgi:hypothetical protein
MGNGCLDNVVSRKAIMFMSSKPGVLLMLGFVQQLDVSHLTITQRKLHAR